MTDLTMPKLPKVSSSEGCTVHKYEEGQKPKMKELLLSIFKDAASVKTTNGKEMGYSQIETTYYNKTGEIIGSTRKVKFSDGSECTLVRAGGPHFGCIDYVDRDNDGTIDVAYKYGNNYSVFTNNTKK